MICQYSFSMSEDKDTFFYRYHYWFTHESDTYARTFIASVSDRGIFHSHKDGKKSVPVNLHSRLIMVQNRFAREVSSLCGKLVQLHSLLREFESKHPKISNESYEIRGLEQVLFFTMEDYVEFAFEMHMTERNISGLYLSELAATFELASVEDFCIYIKKSSSYRLQFFK